MTMIASDAALSQPRNDRNEQGLFVVRAATLLGLSFLLAPLHLEIGFTLRGPQMILALLFVYYVFRRGIVISWYLLLVPAALTILVVNENMGLTPIVQIIGIMTFSMSAYLAVSGDQPKRIFRIYMYVCVGMVLLGFLQAFIPALLPKRVEMVGGLNRITGLYNEPAHLGMVLAPAVHIALQMLLHRTGIFGSAIRKRRDVLVALILVLGQLMTFSTVAYIGLLASTLLLFPMGKFSTKLKTLVALALLIGIAMSIEQIRWRILSIGTISSNDSSNSLSVFTLYVNLMVTFETLKEFPLFGSGIGTYINNYIKHAGQFNLGILGRYGLNSNDASSLFLRITAEMGLSGLLLLAYLIRRYFVGYGYNTPGNSAVILINHGSLVYISLQLLRMGNYMWAELWIFVALYVVTGNLDRYRRKNIVRQTKMLALVEKH